MGLCLLVRNRTQRQALSVPDAIRRYLHCVANLWLAEQVSPFSVRYIPRRGCAHMLCSEADANACMRHCKSIGKLTCRKTGALRLEPQILASECQNLPLSSLQRTQGYVKDLKSKIWHSTLLLESENIFFPLKKKRHMVAHAGHEPAGEQAAHSRPEVRESADEGSHRTKRGYFKR